VGVSADEDIPGTAIAIKTPPPIEIEGKNDRRSRWLQSLVARRGKNKAAVALANKNARIIWASGNTSA